MCAADRPATSLSRWPPTASHGWSSDLSVVIETGSVGTLIGNVRLAAACSSRKSSICGAGFQHRAEQCPADAACDPLRVAVARRHGGPRVDWHLGEPVPSLLGQYRPRSGRRGSYVPAWEVVREAPTSPRRGPCQASEAGRKGCTKDVRAKGFEFTIGSGPGIRTLNLAVNRSLHPVQKFGSDLAECR
jgi:hypothetical protein